MAINAVNTTSKSTATLIAATVSANPICKDKTKVYIAKHRYIRKMSLYFRNKRPFAKRKRSFVLIFSSLCEFEAIGAVEFFVSAFVEGIADFLHQFVVEIEVVHNGETHTECLARFE